MRVQAAGGVSQPVVLEKGKDNGTPAQAGRSSCRTASHFLYTIVEGNSPEMTLMVGELDSTTSKPLFKTTTRVQYAEPGYLLFVRDRTLVAQKFDARSLTLEGEPVPLGEGLGSDDVGLASFSASRTGVLVFKGGELAGTRLIWIDRSGKETPFLDAPADYRDTSFSPDGTRLAYDVSDSGQPGGPVDSRPGAWRLVAFHLRRRPPRSTRNGHPTAGGSSTRRTRRGRGDLFVKDASGTREAEPLLVDPDEKYVSDWSSDGRYILFTSRGDDGSGWNIWAVPIDGDRKPIPIVKTAFNEMWATFSPDGKYIAYQSNESGRQEIYVHEFPEAREQVAGVDRGRNRTSLAPAMAASCSTAPERG